VILSQPNRTLGRIPCFRGSSIYRGSHYRTTSTSSTSSTNRSHGIGINQAWHTVELLANQFQATTRGLWDTCKDHLHTSNKQSHQQPNYYSRTLLLLQETRQVYTSLPQLLFLDRPGITSGISLVDQLQFFNGHCSSSQQCDSHFDRHEPDPSAPRISVRFFISRSDHPSGSGLTSPQPLEPTTFEPPRW
jgi:hypothetical protein